MYVEKTHHIHHTTTSKSNQINKTNEKLPY